ncbi:MAG: L polymerase [Angavokely henipavirus]|nr:MAG: L polymerase [Angavokely henipavirus]
MDTDISISEILYPECHLDSPIVTGKLMQHLEYTGLPYTNSLEDKTLIRNIHIKKLKGVRTSNPLVKKQAQFGEFIKEKYPELLKYKNPPYPYRNKELFRLSDPLISSKLSTLLKHANRCYDYIAPNLLKLLEMTSQRLGRDPTKEWPNYQHVQQNILHLSRVMEGSDWYYPFLFWFTLKTEMRGAIKDSKKKSNYQLAQITEIRSNKLIIVLNPNLLAIYSIQTQEVYYLTFEMVLMFCDVIEGRLMISVGIFADPKYDIYQERGPLLWGLIDDLFQTMGNKTYTVVAMLEPLTLGVLQLKDSSPKLRGSFLHHCTTELLEVLVEKTGFDQNDAEGFIDNLIQIVDIPDIHLIAEFFSFFRTFGHPTLEAENAATKVRTHMHKDKVLEYQIMMKGHAIFCGIIINGFRDRHGGVWPSCFLPDHASPLIKSKKMNGEALTIEDCAENWKSFCGFNFDCFMPLTLDDDLSMYMKDKALSPIRSQWDSVYPTSNMTYNPPISTSSRRLVDVFINDADFEPSKLIDYVISGEYLDDKEFNISYSLKEKEVKEVGRLFAKMTYKMRACQVIAESLIATGVGKYFKENGMVKDEQELLKTLHQLSVSAVPRRGNPKRSFWKNASLTHGNGRSNLCNVGEQSIQNHSKVPRKHSSSIVSHTESNGPCREVDNTYECEFKALHERLNPFRSNNNETGAEVGPRKDFCDPDNRPQSHPTIWDQSKSQSDQYDTVSCFVTTDLEKFCLNWRAESTRIFTQRLNEIYGLPQFFDWMHQILERSTLYVSDPYCPPKFNHHIELDETPDDHIYIKYPMGGIEGYCQKVWTIITIPFLLLSAYETNTRIAAVVQGDNEAIAVTKRVMPNLSYRAKKNISARAAEEYFLKLRSNLRAIGHNLKWSETIVSNHFLIYSKRIYYDGSVLSQSLKSLSRVVFWSETLVDETKSACSNISTTVAKSIENGFDRSVGYCINVLKTIQQIHVSLGFSINSTLTPDLTNEPLHNRSWLITCALLPAAIGGYNYLNLSRIYLRNVGDPVVAAFADLKRMIDANILDRSIIQKVMNQEPGEASFLDWASDPYSVNLPQSQSITKLIKNVTARTVLSHSVNPVLHDLFHDRASEEDHELAVFLMDRKMLLPRTAHEILSNSITGAREEIAGMLDTTKGLIRTGLRKGGIQPRLVNRLSHHDYEQFRVFNQLIRERRTNSLISHKACSVDLAKAMRAHMWRDLAYGRVIYGLEVPDPLECVKGTIIKGSENCSVCEFEETPYCWFFIPSEIPIDRINVATPSIRVPYVGSTTEERSEIKLGTLRSSSKALKAAIRIAMVYTWAYGDDEDSWLEAWYLANQRANIPLDILKAVTPMSTSNNLAHRLRDRVTQVKFSGASLNRVSKFVTISNDNLVFKIEGETIDTNFIFQQVMLLGLSTLEDLFRFNDSTGDSNTVMHLHVIDNCCISQIPILPPLPSELEPPEYQEIQSNSLIYDNNPIIETDLNKLSVQTWRSSEVHFPTWSTLELHEGLAQSLAVTIIEIISKSDKDELKEYVTLQSEDTVNSLITEFLLVDIELFVLNLGLVSAIKWSFDIHYRRPQGRYAMVDYFFDCLNQTSKTTFVVLANAISHPRVFKRFVDRGILLPQYGPYLHQQDFMSAAKDLLARSYMSYLINWVTNKTLIYPLMEQSEEVVDQRIDIIQARHLCMICDLYCNDAQPPWIVEMTAIEKCAVLTAFIESLRKSSQGAENWNVSPLSVIVYPSSSTYIRRGVIKQLRIREVNEIAEDPSQLLRTVPLNKPSSLLFNQTERDIVSISYSDILEEEIIDLNMSATLDPESRSLESHKYRRVGLNSTSAYKALDLAAYIVRYYKQSSDRLFIGEGSGSMLLTYLFLLGKAKCYYNSGVTSDVVIGQRELKIYPAEVCIADQKLSTHPSLLSYVVPLFNGRPETTWIGEMDAYMYIINTIKEKKLGLVHSDMESGIDKDFIQILKEHSHLISIAINLMLDEGLLISKICPTCDFPITALLNLYKSCFHNLELLFPRYSNPESSECYIACFNPRITGITSPDRIFQLIGPSSQQIDEQLYNFITNTKFNIDQELKCDQMNDYFDVYDINSGLVCELTDDDKTLLSFGLTLNGPEIIKEISSVDPSSLEESLVQTIRINIQDILDLTDERQKPRSFFEPYPVLESSRRREIIHRVVKKLTVLMLIKGYQKTGSIDKVIVMNLRQGFLLIETHFLTRSGLFSKRMLKRISEAELEPIWTYQLSRREQKKWWKLISYLPLTCQV